MSETGDTSDANTPMFNSLSLQTKSESVYLSIDLDIWFNKLIHLLELKFVESPLKDSNWQLAYVNNVELNIYKFLPHSGSTCIPLPSIIAKKKRVINIQNNDAMCFAYAIACKVLHDKKI